MPGSVNCSFINQPDWSGLMQADSRTNDIYIWHGVTAHLSGLYYPFHSLLSKTEQATAASFADQASQEMFVVHHGVLRLLLGSCLNLGAADITFDVNPDNKPHLAGVVQPPLFFNLSSSAGVFLIAIGCIEMGIDIESINTGIDWQSIASQYFSETELQYISIQNDPAEAFFRLWTRKESLLKACGMGINDNLPAMPALDGLHALPDYYPAKDFLTKSFFIRNDFMASVTFPAPNQNIKVAEITLPDVVTIMVNAMP